MKSTTKKDIVFGEDDLLEKDEFDPKHGKERITIMLDMQVVDAFREEAKKSGKKYQALIRETLRDHVFSKKDNIDLNAEMMKLLIMTNLRNNSNYSLTGAIEEFIKSFNKISPDKDKVYNQTRKLVEDLKSQHFNEGNPLDSYFFKCSYNNNDMEIIKKFVEDLVEPYKNQVDEIKRLLKKKA